MRKNKDYFAIIIKFFDKYPREYYLVALFIFAALIIIYSVFSYTVINYDFYKKLADKQQL